MARTTVARSIPAAPGFVKRLQLRPEQPGGYALPGVVNYDYLPSIVDVCSSMTSNVLASCRLACMDYEWETGSWNLSVRPLCMRQRKETEVKGDRTLATSADGLLVQRLFRALRSGRRKLWDKTAAVLSCNFANVFLWSSEHPACKGR